MARHHSRDWAPFPRWFWLILFPGMILPLSFSVGVWCRSGNPTIMLHGFATSAVVAASVLAYATLHAQSKRTLLSNTFALIDRFNRGELVNTVRWVDADLPDICEEKKLSVVEVVEEAKQNREITQLLNQIEDVLLAIQTGYADGDILYHSLRYVVTTTHRNLQPWIEREREEDATVFADATELAGLWEERDKATPVKRI